MATGIGQKCYTALFPLLSHTKNDTPKMRKNTEEMKKALKRILIFE